MSPAADTVAMPLGILVTFKALKDVVAVAETCHDRCTRCCIGTRARSAQKHHQRLSIDLMLQL
ncbi:hypothetical protein SDC9_173897 [bioreactor metagenome]|uniref:Uncharacterized protein n=1 Tax=bioreactor metagenome TaxID=1076179 RepID=A0A645GKS4_9ZZZZ